jgi:hypothetical protein
LIGKEDPGVTVNFEVTFVETGQMFHFKRRAGRGRADSPSERKAIVELIQEYLDDMED